MGCGTRTASRRGCAEQGKTPPSHTSGADLVLGHSREHRCFFGGRVQVLFLNPRRRRSSTTRDAQSVRHSPSAGTLRKWYRCCTCSAHWACLLQDHIEHTAGPWRSTAFSMRLPQGSVARVLPTERSPHRASLLTSRLFYCGVVDPFRPTGSSRTPPPRHPSHLGSLGSFSRTAWLPLGCRSRSSSRFVVAELVSFSAFGSRLAVDLRNAYRQKCSVLTA